MASLSGQPVTNKKVILLLVSTVKHVQLFHLYTIGQLEREHRLLGTDSRT